MLTKNIQKVNDGIKKSQKNHTKNINNIIFYKNAKKLNIIKVKKEPITRFLRITI